jgi:nucleotide-binding universal stress UspA family protein
MTQAQTKKTILLYAPVETFSLTAGPASFALDFCQRYGQAMTAILLHTDMAPTFSNPEPADLARRNSENVTALQAKCNKNGTILRTIDTIDHSRGFFPYINDHVRLHDLVICGTDSSCLLSEKMVCEAVLFDGGRPILLVPRGHASGYAARHLAVAWDNSRNAARALGDALALLPAVETVTFLVIGDEKTIATSISPDALVTTMSQRGINASLHHAKKGARGIGKALQEEAHKAGADLLAMGAYGHSRLREFMLGGATQDVLGNLQMPVLMSH